MMPRLDNGETRVPRQDTLCKTNGVGKSRYPHTKE